MRLGECLSQGDPTTCDNAYSPARSNSARTITVLLRRYCGVAVKLVGGAGGAPPPDL